MHSSSTSCGEGYIPSESDPAIIRARSASQPPLDEAALLSVLLLQSPTAGDHDFSLTSRRKPRFTSKTRRAISRQGKSPGLLGVVMPILTPNRRRPHLRRADLDRTLGPATGVRR